MAVIDISGRMGKGNNRIAFVGLEVEGGWMPRPKNAKVIHDGSVFNSGQFPNGFVPDKSSGGRNYGEIVSPVMEPIGIPVWMRRFYPTHADKSCGLHVHMSFKDASYYAALMTRDYQDTILAELEKWARLKNISLDNPLWDRLAGKNRYCSKDYWADAQALQRSKSFDQCSGSRYTVINYCYGLHGTIECRVLPVLPDVLLGISAVKCVLDVTNAVLNVKFGRKQKIVEEIILPATGDFDEEVDHELV